MARPARAHNPRRMLVCLPAAYYYRYYKGVAGAAACANVWLAAASCEMGQTVVAKLGFEGPHAACPPFLMPPHAHAAQPLSSPESTG